MRVRVHTIDVLENKHFDHVSFEHSVLFILIDYDGSIYDVVYFLYFQPLSTSDCAFSVNISLYWFGYFISLCLHSFIKDAK